MIFNVKPKDGKETGKIRLFYLTKGTTWTPCCRVDILDAKRLRIEQAAQIHNEWLPIKDAEISLVSGFPQIGSSQIISPLAPDLSLAQFFREITNQNNNAYGERYGNNTFTSNSIAVQAYTPSQAELFDVRDLATGEGPDIYYHDIGETYQLRYNAIGFAHEQSLHVVALTCSAP
ncbi:MAG: hypothetical protein LBJ00_07795 [Planctomycetaceae bacterium]|jgi:hypothetical protein|nr:hypothetical protein [Planctomycetaceae bacterium]